MSVRQVGLAVQDDHGIAVAIVEQCRRHARQLGRGALRRRVAQHMLQRIDQQVARETDAIERDAFARKALTGLCVGGVEHVGEFVGELAGEVGGALLTRPAQAGTDLHHRHRLALRHQTTGQRSIAAVEHDHRAGLALVEHEFESLRELCRTGRRGGPADAEIDQTTGHVQPIEQRAVAGIGVVGVGTHHQHDGQVGATRHRAPQRGRLDVVGLATDHAQQRATTASSRHRRYHGLGVVRRGSRRGSRIAAFAHRLGEHRQLANGDGSVLMQRAAAGGVTRRGRGGSRRQRRDRLDGNVGHQRLGGRSLERSLRGLWYWTGCDSAACRGRWAYRAAGRLLQRQVALPAWQGQRRCRRLVSGAPIRSRGSAPAKPTGASGAATSGVGAVTVGWGTTASTAAFGASDCT